MKSFMAPDKRLQALLRDVKSGKYSVPTSSMLTELSNMHSTRYARKLSTSQVLRSAQRELIEASLQNQSFRSRCVEIQVRCFRVQSMLKNRTENMLGYLLTKYADILSDNFRTKDDKVSYVKVQLHPCYFHVEQLSRVTSVADMIVEDLDKAQWSLKAVIDVLNLSSAREKNI